MFQNSQYTTCEKLRGLLSVINGNELGEYEVI